MINLHQLIYALSDALDLVGVDDSNHGRRVAYMALVCANELNMNISNQIKLFRAALLHDCGVSSTRIHNKLVSTLDWEGAREHCIRGYQLLSLSPELQQLNNIVLYHHTHYEVLEKMNLDRETSLLSNLIFMVDRIDALTSQQHAKETSVPLLALASEIQEEVQKLSGSFFDPKLVEAFIRASQREVFWLTLESDNLHRYLNEYICSLQSEEIDLISLGHISELFAHIVDAKSPYTADHSLDVAKLSQFIATQMGLEPEVCTKIEIAGLLHDIGKLRIPDELLNKEGPLTDEEFSIIKTHASSTHQILSQVQGLEEIVEWASQHHEKLNGKGYPYHIKEKNMSLPARIIAVADIFQALAQKRPYRTNLTPLKILEILQEKVTAGDIDPDVVTVIQNNLQECWEISLYHSHRMMEEG